MKLEHRKDSLPIGGYYEGDGKIYIASGLGVLEKEVLYFHERQHMICHKTGCSCWGRKKDTLSERHAFVGELRAVLRRGSKRLAQAYLRCVGKTRRKNKANPKIWAAHAKAIEYIEKMPEYKQVVKLAGRK
jgi:hypothetical protein